MVMSFGLVEHFLGNDRLRVFRAHKELVNDKGLIIISVPNKLSLPYQYWMSKSKRLGKWIYGTEVPFSRSEVKILAENSGIKVLALKSSSFADAVYEFILKNRFPHLKWLSKIESPLDDYLGYALIMIGE